jgi:dCMP deaminase
MRLTIPEYALAIAKVAASRSEDPYLQVGAVVLDKGNHVIGTGYNGLMPGFTPPAGFWEDREARTPYIIHAEINALSLVKRGEAHTIAVTTCPCQACAMAILAHGIKHVIYRDKYERDQLQMTERIFNFYGVQLLQL